MVDIIYEDPTTLNPAAEELGLEVQSAGPFGRGGGEGIAANQDVVNTAFSDMVLSQGAVSDPVDLGTNHIVVMRLREYLPSALMPLEQVRDRVVESVRRERAMQAASSAANELLAALEGGADIASLAESRGLALVESEAATRTSPDIDARLRSQVFLLSRPEGEQPVTDVVELNDGYAVVQLNSVRDGELAEGEALRGQAYRRRISNASASAEALGFLRMLREQSTIEVFEDRL
jgi:peptidyl-prolyl cis-trans isomerase D